MARHSETLDTGGRVLRRAPDRWKQGWTGDASDFMAGQTRELASDTRGFVRHLEAAADAVKAFADLLDEAVDHQLPDLNRRWDEAARVYDDAVLAADRRRTRSMDGLPEGTTGQQRQQARRETDDIRFTAVSVAHGLHSAAQEKLKGEYDDLVDDLARAARKMSRRLQESVPLPIKAGEAGPFTAKGLAQHPMGTLPSDDLLRRLRDRAEKKYGGPAYDLLLELTTPSNDLTEVTEMLERARGLGLEPHTYRETLEQYWFLEAAASAGIDVTQWEPSKGAAHNAEIIMAVYRYYGDLYLENADLQWAGMANMIGPSFAGGFLDLSMMRDMAKHFAQYPVGRLPFDREAFSALAGMTDEDLEFYETTLLGMQRDIFFDQGSAHEAYREGGMTAIKEMYEAGILDRATYESWQGIDSGDPERVQAGNEQLLHREQHDIIEHNYKKMYNHPPTGQVMTWVMTQIGAPSIPGAVSYADIDPWEVAMPTPGPRNIGIPFTPFQTDNPLQGDAVVETPLAAGNVAHFDDRWRLIRDDTLPAYQRLLRDDLDLAQALIGADVKTRVDEYRLAARVDDILVDLATDWEMRFEQ